MTTEQRAVRPVSGDPEAGAAEPCDEHCDIACVHHTPSVGWDLSFGSRINFHPVDTTDGRLVVSLHLSDDAVATGLVYREVSPQQVVAFAQQLLALVGAQWKLVPAGECPAGTHRGPEGPNEDVSQCVGCGAVSHEMRPDGETYGRHLADCSLPRRHASFCEPGGAGHPLAPVIRGFWPGE